MAYQVRRGKHLEIRMDPGDARATVYYRYPGDEWDVTPFQTADARHDLGAAYRMVREWDAGQGSRRLRRNPSDYEDVWPGERAVMSKIRQFLEWYASKQPHYGRVWRDRKGRVISSYSITPEHEEMIQELNRGDEEELKARLHWIRTYYPEYPLGDSKDRTSNPSIRSYGIQRYQQALEALKGKYERRLSANTVLRNVGGGEIQVVLHATPVVTFYEDGRVRLRSGGWMTSTTKARINQFSPFRVSQKHGEWTVTLPGGETMEFEDGMVIG